MKDINRISRRAVSALAAAATFALFSGCNGPRVCELYEHLCLPEGGTPCTFSDGAPVGDDCGSFVRIGDDGGADRDGTKDAPYTSIADAIEHGDGAIYVCGDATTEAVSLPAGRRLYGGFACDAWRWDEAGRTTIAPPAGEIPLLLEGGGATIVEGFTLIAADAETPGDSSIALVAVEVTADIDRVDIVAGNGASGAAGLPGAAGDDGNPGATATGTTGAIGGTSGCGAQGGRGGDGGAPASAGTPGAPSQDNGGDAGCTSGGDGDIGSDGQPGADATDLGAPTATGFRTGEPGPPGTNGTHGGGGGGGGAVASGGGGGGGAGGCLGTAGTAGTSGGSTIAIVWIDSSVRFANSTAAVGEAGDAGAGGEGGNGGSEGEGGLGAGACSGGDGGPGGSGGRGAHGVGGHALIVAFTGSEPDLSGLGFTAPEPARAGNSSGLEGSAAVALGFDR